MKLDMGSRVRHARKLLVIALVSVTLFACNGGGSVDSIFPTATLSGVYCGSGGGPCLTDNTGLSYHIQGTVPGTEHDEIENTLYGSYDATLLNVSEELTPSYTGANETDIIYQKGSVSGTAMGITWCDDAATLIHCDQHYVRIETTFSTTVNVACHETGHAVGLVHGSAASPVISDMDNRLHCMKGPASTTSTLGPHNIGQINGEWD